MQDAEQRQQGEQQLIAETRKLASAMAPLASGPYFAGQDFTFVDLALAPMWQRILWVGGHYRNLELPEEGSDADFHRMAEWWEAVSSRESVAATLVCRERLIASYAQYADNTATSDVAKQMQSRMRS